MQNTIQQYFGYLEILNCKLEENYKNKFEKYRAKKLFCE